MLIGSIGYRWLGNASFVLAAADEPGRRQWPPGYDRLILIAGVARGRRSGAISLEVNTCACETA